jgi:hypothetical protein
MSIRRVLLAAAIADAFALLFTSWRHAAWYYHLAVAGALLILLLVHLDRKIGRVR